MYVWLSFSSFNIKGEIENNNAEREAERKEWEKEEVGGDERKKGKEVV